MQQVGYAASARQPLQSRVGSNFEDVPLGLRKPVLDSNGP